MPTNQTRRPNKSRTIEGRTPLLGRILWLCVAVGLLVGSVVLWLFGFTLWAAAALVLLFICPLVVVWVLRIERQQNLTHRNTS